MFAAVITENTCTLSGGHGLLIISDVVTETAVFSSGGGDCTVLSHDPF